VDLDAALAEARASNRAVLLVFHGSNWCPPCKALSRNVFASPEFAAFAGENLVLVDVDFPTNQPGMPQAVYDGNVALKARYNVGREWHAGFPSIVLLNRDGDTLLQRKGYSGEPADAILALLADAARLR
jgi:thioredoxin-related protein